MRRDDRSRGTYEYFFGGVSLVHNCYYIDLYHNLLRPDHHQLPWYVKLTLLLRDI